MSKTARHAPDGGWGWVIVCSSFIIHFFTVGTMFSLSVLYVPWLDTFGSSKGVTSWIISVGVAFMFGIGPLPAALAARFGHQAVVVAGGLLSCAGLVISHSATNVFYLILSVGIITGSGLGFCYLPAISMVAVYFDKRRSLAMGMGTSGVGIGSFVMAPLFHWLNEEYGWRGTLLITGAISLHLCVCGLLMRPLKSTPLTTTEVKSTGVGTDTDQMHQNEKEVMNQNGSVPECKALTVAASEAATERTGNDSDPLLSSANGAMFNETSGAPNNGRYQGHFLKTQRDQIGGSVRVLHTPRRPSQNSVARLVSSAMELRPSNNDTQKMYFKDRENGAPSVPLTIRDILMSGSIHSLALIDGKLGESKDLVFVPTPETSDTASEAQIVTSSRCSCSESIAKTCLSVFSSFALLKNGVFATFVVSNILTNLTFLMPVLYMVDRALDNGIDTTTAALFVSLNGAGNLFGRLLFGFLADRSFADCLICYIGCLTVCGLATSFSPLCGTSAVLHGMYAFTFGCFIGGYVSLAPVVTVDLMGVSLVGEAYGVVLLFMGVAGIAGPPLAGWIVDWTGDFTTSFVMFGIFALLSGLILLPIVYMRKCKKPTEAQELVIE